MNSQTLKDKIFGSFFGAACGDCLGAGVEFMSSAEINNRFPNGLTEFPVGSPFGFKPGEITDDTEQAILLAEAIIETEKHGGSETDFWNSFGNKLIEWRKNSKDCGNQTSVGISRFKSGATYEDMIESGPNTRPSNGAVMRVYPVALAYFNDLDKMCKYTRIATAITHPHKEAIVCALILNMTISFILKNDKFQKSNIYSFLLGSECMPHFNPNERLVAKEIINLVCQGEPVRSYTLAREALHVGFCFGFMNIDIWNNPVQNLIIKACSFGGDNDTHGAVTGAIVGANYGMARLDSPYNWIPNIKRNKDIFDVCEKLFDLNNNLSNFTQENPNFDKEVKIKKG